MFSGLYLPSVVRTEKRIVVRQQSHRNRVVSFVFGQCVDYNYTLKAKGILQDAHGNLHNVLISVSCEVGFISMIQFGY